jgi:hypothetical protein
MSNAIYSTLIAAWNNVTQPPPGITGTALTGLTTANKIIAVNGWLVTGTIPATLTVSGSQLANCVNWTEFNALTAAQQTNLMQLFTLNNLAGGTTNAAFLTDGMMIAYFTNASGPTRLALAALAQAQPWWNTSVANGGSGLFFQITQTDVTNAGLS